MDSEVGLYTRPGLYNGYFSSWFIKSSWLKPMWELDGISWSIYYWNFRVDVQSWLDISRVGIRALSVVILCHFCILHVVGHFEAEKTICEAEPWGWSNIFLWDDQIHENTTLLWGQNPKMPKLFTSRESCHRLGWSWNIEDLFLADAQPKFQNDLPMAIPLKNLPPISNSKNWCQSLKLSHPENSANPSFSFGHPFPPATDSTGPRPQPQGVPAPGWWGAEPRPLRIGAWCSSWKELAPKG